MAYPNPYGGFFTSGAQKGYVTHGADANYSRPVGFVSVEWTGSVEPVNAINGDTWVPTA